MKHFTLPFFIFLLWLTPEVQSQIVRMDTVTHWKKKFASGLNFNQASFSSNWKGGGVNSIGLNGLINYKASYKNRSVSWDNELDFHYGFVRNEGQGFRKTIDRIFLDTKYGYAISPKWDLSISLNFLTQFYEGFKYEKDGSGVEQSYLISDFLAPGFLTMGLGFQYQPADYFKGRISPFAPRLTVVQDPLRFKTTVGPVPYGVDTTETIRFEWFAFQLTADFNKEIAKNINLKFRYMLFANYETFEVDKIDHRFDLSLTAKVNKFVNVSLGGIMIYDYDQDTEVQLSQILNIGFLYTFINFKE